MLIALHVIEIVKMEMVKYLVHVFPKKYLDQINEKIRGENLLFEKKSAIMYGR